jgi:hypothetical protein
MKPSSSRAALTSAATSKPTIDDLARMWGVTTDFFQTPRTRIHHFNAVFPWRVMPDGTVHNALFP